MKNLSNSRVVIFLLVVLELCSSWHLGVKPDCTFLAAAMLYLLRKKK